MIYSLLYGISLSAILPFQILKRPSGLRKRWLSERLGFIPSAVDDEDCASKKRVWIHAVSVGESVASRPLIAALRGSFCVAVSTVTDTGQKVMGDFMRENERCFYLPFDLTSSVRRSIERARPDILLIMETEFWPHLLRVTKEHHIPVMIVNGRISDNSFSGYRKIRFFIQPLLRMVHYFFMQTERDAERIIQLGAPGDRVMVTGNLKFDVEPAGDADPWFSDLGKPTIVAGSTHEGEERIILEAFLSLKRKFQKATLVIAPRHPERFPLVEKLLSEQGVPFSKRSNCPGSKEDVVLLDTIGELSSVYGCADICVIGGSFIPRGGHNLFEPAYWGKPIVCGPHMENFPLAHTFFEQGAAIEAQEKALETVLSRVLNDGHLISGMGKRAQALYTQNAGAVVKTVEKVSQFLRSP
jgi:3-deoxy-D-manno-octulosonic-acid transferase